MDYVIEEGTVIRMEDGEKFPYVMGMGKTSDGEFAITEIKFDIKGVWKYNKPDVNLTGVHPLDLIWSIEKVQKFHAPDSLIEWHNKSLQAVFSLGPRTQTTYMEIVAAVERNVEDTLKRKATIQLLKEQRDFALENRDKFDVLTHMR